MLANGYVYSLMVNVYPLMDMAYSFMVMIKYYVNGYLLLDVKVCKWWCPLTIGKWLFLGEPACFCGYIIIVFLYLCQA